jgi:hypothetical protein
MALFVMRRDHVRPFEHSLLTKVLVGITIGLLGGGRRYPDGVDLHLRDLPYESRRHRRHCLEIRGRGRWKKAPNEPLLGTSRRFSVKF